MNELLENHWHRLWLKFSFAICMLVLLYSFTDNAMIKVAQAHGGGTPRLTNATLGPYRVYAWSEPEPWRVGDVHLSLAVTQPNPDTTSNQVEIPVMNPDLLVTFTPLDGSSAPIVVTPVRQTFLGDFYFEADTLLPTAGSWNITIAVTGEDGAGSTDFQMEALPPRTINWTLVASAAGLLVVLVILIAIWSRAQRSAQSARPSRPGARRPQRSVHSETQREL
jgi:hypothetical protein